MVLNEVLHKAQESLKAFVLLKLDTIKASNCMDWVFLYRLLEFIGVGPNFINMVKVANAFATCVILIQGKIEEAGEDYTHGQYIDDTNVVI